MKISEGFIKGCINVLKWSCLFIAIALFGILLDITLYELTGWPL